MTSDLNDVTARDAVDSHQADDARADADAAVDLFDDHVDDSAYDSVDYDGPGDASGDSGSAADVDAHIDADVDGVVERPGEDVHEPDLPWDAPSDVVIPPVYAPEYCAYFLTGEVDLVGDDADGDGVANSWDQCPNNPYDWLDSDRDGTGNRSDSDMDGDGVSNDEDSDRDGDGFEDVTETSFGTDSSDPSMIPGWNRFGADITVHHRHPAWYLGETHLHVEYRPGISPPLKTFFASTERSGLDFVCVVDNWVFDSLVDPYWNESPLLLIPGVEWGGESHANMWGIRTDNLANYSDPDDVRRAWQVARLQGGTLSINHYGADSFYWDPLFESAPDLFDSVDAIEVWNKDWTNSIDTNEPAIDLWERLLNEGRHVAAVAGGDTILPVDIYDGPTTAVWAGSLSVPAILHGIRSGRTYLTQSDPRSFDGRPELDFRVDADGDNVFEAMVGDEVPAGTINIQVSVLGARGPVVLIRNGAWVARFADHDYGADASYFFSDQAEPGSWYRVEMRESDLPDAPMWLMSSAIYVAK